ncbi:hypothetical protein ACLOJK_004468, partial [Asimina triloba]
AHQPLWAEPIVVPSQNQQSGGPRPSNKSPMEIPKSSQAAAIANSASKQNWADFVCRQRSSSTQIRSSSDPAAPAVSKTHPQTVINQQQWDRWAANPNHPRQGRPHNGQRLFILSSHGRGLSSNRKFGKPGGSPAARRQQAPSDLQVRSAINSKTISTSSAPKLHELASKNQIRRTSINRSKQGGPSRSLQTLDPKIGQPSISRLH